MLPAKLTWLLATASSAQSLARVTHARVTGQPPERLEFGRPASAAHLSFVVTADRPVFGAGATVTTVLATGGHRHHAPPPQRSLYAGRRADGAWVRATLEAAPRGAWAIDAMVFVPTEGALYSVSTSVGAAEGGWLPVELHVHSPDADDGYAWPLRLLPATWRRGLQLQTAAPPWGRLAGCNHTLRTLSLGFVLDSGFVAVRGGAEGALSTTAGALSRVNAIFEQQLGVRLVVEHVVLNEGAADGASFAVTGPNDAPVNGSGSRSCPSYQAERVSGHGLNVTVQGADLALGRLSQWAGAHAPAAVGAWHLLTDCFPRPGTVGVAWRDSACMPQSYAVRAASAPLGPFLTPQSPFGRPPSISRRLLLQMVYGDSGEAGDDDSCITVDGTCGAGGCTCAHMTPRVPTSTCATGSVACQYGVGLSSNSARLWLTLGHEIGHQLGGGHTFEHGGLMAYSDEQKLYDSGDICPSITAKLGDACFAEAPAECGDGRVDAGESCDDGGTAGGDGCDSGCAVECGWSCAEALGEDGAGLGASACVPSCGNGVVEHELGEQCDPPSGCCTASCRLAANASCCGGECCSGGGEWLNTATLCASGASHCDGRGVCLTSSHCDLAANLLLDVASCPVDPDNSCRPRCAMTDADGALLGCHLVGGASFPEGAICETADGQRGACAVLDGGVGACLVPSTYGDGVLSADEACDDASACCDHGVLALGAACSGDCCPNCTAASTLLEGACSGMGGFCYDGACVTNASGFLSQPRLLQTGVGVTTELRVGTGDCPLLGGGCTA